MTHDTPQLVTLYTWGETDRRRIAEFRWNAHDGVTLTLLDPNKKALAEEYYDNGVVLEPEGELVTRDDGPAFMRALLQPLPMSYYAFVDES
jgi:hypothetical protein